MLQNGATLVDHSTLVASHSPFPAACSSESNNNINGSCVMNGTNQNIQNNNSIATSTCTTNGSPPHPPSSLSPTLCGNSLTSILSVLATTGGLPPNIKDSRWLTLEVCRQFQRNQCSRDEKECKFAHPPTHVDVQNGRVICCYDSIKGKCQRRDPPCKYLHPPQHLREQLLQNGRNNMILRNMQLQFFQQQLLAQHTGVVPFQTTVAAVGACSSPASGGSSSSLTGTTGPTPLIYPGAGSLGLNSRTISSNYPFLNFGYNPFLNTLTGSCPDFLASEHINDCGKRNTITDVKTCLPTYFSRQNGGLAQTNGTQNSKALESIESQNMLVNGTGIDSSGMVDLNSASSQSVNICSTLEAAATLYALQCSHNAALLNLHAPPPPHPTGPPTHHPLNARSLVTCTVGGPTMAPNPYHTLADHAGFFQPTYHIEIPPFPYQ